MTPIHRPPKRGIKPLSAGILVVCSWVAAADPAKPITERSLEDLLNLQVFSASKFSQRSIEAPSAVTVITANDIKTYGYRTLGEVLRSIRGLYLSYDRNYQYLGVRGGNRPGDYNSRVLLLIDGFRTNDNVYDMAYIDRSFLLDVDLIDRVEFVPGPGSSLYGSNAFFGVINVITRQGRDIGNGEASGEVAGFDTNKQRFSLGHRFENGFDALVSATRYESSGQDLYYPEYAAPDTRYGRADGLDGERQGSLFARFAHGGWTLQSGLTQRRKDIPTGQYDTVFAASGTRTLDREAYVNLEYQSQLTSSTELSARLFYGQYLFNGSYVYPDFRNHDQTHGQWWGGEVKWFSTMLERQKITFGSEFQLNVHQDQYNYDSWSATGNRVENLDDHRDGDRFGFYLQDEIDIVDGLKLNAGLRHDRYSTFGGTINPRLGLVYQPAPATAVKFIYGTAFRAPNVYELYYWAPGPSGQKPNPHLDPESIQTYELAVESHWAGWLFTGSLFRYEIHDLISQSLDPNDGFLVFRNIGEARIDGVGTEIERAWSNGLRLRGSYSWQYGEDTATGRWLINSPKHLVKLNLSAPLCDERLRLGFENQYTSARKTDNGGEADGYFLSNLTLTAQRLMPGVELSASVYNLFDVRYFDPVDAAHRQDMILQDGRNFRLKLTLRF
ncbi:MAG: TonB-dependent receptor [Methylococcaceae bacterium]|nr:MAG: TonB-dependent receptor [Methylococcaceae bacterium]